jgi:hypothetical protein
LASIRRDSLISDSYVEELVEIIIRRYKRAGTMLTSNRQKTGANCWATLPR